MADQREYTRLTGNVLRSEDVDDMISIYGGAIAKNMNSMELNRTHQVAGGERTNIDDIITEGDGSEINPNKNAWIFAKDVNVTDESTNIRKVVITSDVALWVAVYGVNDYLGYVGGTIEQPAWLDAASFEEQSYEEFGRISWDNATAGLSMRFARYSTGANVNTISLDFAQDVKAVVVSPDPGATASSIVVTGFKA